ncbi:LysR substrate-binding domain-containing protein [Burkholderia sp. BCC1993]|uniref:LysR substrate-binding domain-containing protein n=1 Tax=Burkholderia sp. BCC1993 TaxID=2817444 RepID=UPI0039EEBC0A
MSSVPFRGKDGALTGHVRLSVPATYGHYRLPPLLRQFTQQHPQVRVELKIANRNGDLMAEGFEFGKFVRLTDCHG